MENGAISNSRWALTGAAYYDVAQNIQADGGKGKRMALVGVAEYALSKRAQVYGTVDYNKVYDASSVGIRHIF